VEMGAGEEASPWDEAMVGMRRAIGLVRTYSLVDGSMGAELAEGTAAAGDDGRAGQGQANVAAVIGRRDSPG
jgi:hypothetical protein